MDAQQGIGLLGGAQRALDRVGIDGKAAFPVGETGEHPRHAERHLRHVRLDRHRLDVEDAWVLAGELPPRLSLVRGAEELS
jgi:hypothetical protein